jgi:hypothetical protein
VPSDLLNRLATISSSNCVITGVIHVTVMGPF